MHRLLTFLNLAYTFLVLKLFEYVQCADNVDGNSYLAVEPSVQCYQFHDAYTWGRLFPPALAATVFYVIGIPVVIGYLLLSLRHNKNGPGPVALLGSIYGRYANPNPNPRERRSRQTAPSNTDVMLLRPLPTRNASSAPWSAPPSQQCSIAWHNPNPNLSPTPTLTPNFRWRWLL